MKTNYEILICDCQYWEEPCKFCCIDPIVICENKIMKKSEAIAKTCRHAAQDAQEIKAKAK